MVLLGMECCGMRELTGLFAYNKNPKLAMQHLIGMNNDEMLDRESPYGGRSGQRFRFILFTEAKPTKDSAVSYGKDFAKFIRKNRLGRVTAGPTEQNPNSGNMVTPFIWTIDWNAMNKWIKENPIRCTERDTCKCPRCYDPY